MVDATDVNPLSFEDAFQSLQDVVEKLERGNLPLDESVALFERGTELVRHCTSLLDEAELKIRTLSQGFAEPQAGSVQEHAQPTATDGEQDVTPPETSSLWGSYH